VNQCPGRHYAPVTNLPLRHHRCPNANQRSFANAHLAPQVNTRRNVNVIANAVMMVYCATGVQNDVSADNAARVDHHTGADHAAGADSHVGSDDGTGMTGDDNVLASALQRLE